MNSAHDPRVSVVINNYNYARFLDVAIRSALGQTYPRTEVIVVDDGSTDASREVIARFGDRIRAILKENAGQASALNRGFEESTGEMILFLDADDYLLPEAIGRVVEARHAWESRGKEAADAGSARGAGAAGGTRRPVAKLQFQLELVDEAGRSLDMLRPPRAHGMQDGDVRHELIRRGSYASPPTSGNVFSRVALASLLPIPEERFELSADGYLVGLAPFEGDVVSIREPLGCYRVHGGNRFLLTRAVRPEDLRRNLVAAIWRYEAIADAARAEGLSPERDPGLNDPAHVKSRLASLRLAPDLHPLSGDSRWNLFRAGLRAGVRYPDYSPARRILYLMWLACMAIAPRRLAPRVASLGVAAPQQPALFRRLLGLSDRRGWA